MSKPEPVTEDVLVPTPFGDLAVRKNRSWQPGDGALPFIGLEQIRPYSLELSDDGFETEVSSNKVHFARGDILYGKLRPYFRKCVRAPFDGICSTEIWVVEPKSAELIDADFLYWVMADSAFSDFANLGETGTRMPRASWDHVAAYEVLLPGLDEQKRIASVLNILAERVAGLRHLSSVAGACAQSLASTAPGTCHVSDLATVTRVSFDPTKHTPEIVDHYSLPSFDAGKTPERVVAETIGSGKFEVRTASVLLSRLNPATNRTWLVFPSNDVSRSVCSTEYAVLEPTSVGVGELWAVTSDDEACAILAKAVTGTSASHQRIRAEAVLALDVPDPRTLREEERVELEALATTQVQASREIAELVAMRDFLLPRLLSGELRVSEAETQLEEVS